MAREAENGKKRLLAKVFLFLGFIALISMAVFLGKEVYKKRQIQSEISNLQAEAARVNKENLGIQDKIAYLESRDYQEREAKDKLNLQSPDENVVIIKPGVTKEQSAAAEVIPDVQASAPAVPNPKKWWNYFFKY